MKSSTNIKVHVATASPSSQRGQHSKGPILSFILVSSSGPISDAHNLVMMFSRHDTETQWARSYFLPPVPLFAIAHMPRQCLNAILKVLKQGMLICWRAWEVWEGGIIRSNPNQRAWQTTSIITCKLCPSRIKRWRLEGDKFPPTL